MEVVLRVVGNRTYYMDTVYAVDISTDNSDRIQIFRRIVDEENSSLTAVVDDYTILQVLADINVTIEKSPQIPDGIIMAID